MPKYNVYGIMTASILIGTYEAENKEAAIDMANDDKMGNWNPSLCHHCAGEIDLSDINKTQTDEV